MDPTSKAFMTETASEKLAVLRDLQRDALAEMRSLVFELRPGGIAEQGLEHALRTHASAIEGRIGLPVEVEVTAPPDAERLPIETEEGLYRIAQEALHNVVRHAGASRVRLTLARDASSVRLAVIDDGVVEPPPNWTLDCDPATVVVGGTTYYQCGSAWYVRVYRGGEIAYTMVNPPAVR